MFLSPILGGLLDVPSGAFTGLGALHRCIYHIPVLQGWTPAGLRHPVHRCWCSEHSHTIPYRPSENLPRVDVLGITVLSLT